jgi:hypothetical protein
VVGGDPQARLALAQRLPGEVVVVGDDPAWLQAAEGLVALVLSLPPSEALAAEVVVSAVVDRFGGLGCVVHLPPVLAVDSTPRQWARAFDRGVVALRAVDEAAAAHLAEGCVVYGVLDEATPEGAALNAARRGWAEAHWRGHDVEVRFASGSALLSAVQGDEARAGLRDGLRGVRARARALRRWVVRGAASGDLPSR